MWEKLSNINNKTKMWNSILIPNYKVTNNIKSYVEIHIMYVIGIMNAASLDYLYTKDSNFAGFLEDGNKVYKVLAPGHAYLAIVDGNK